MNTINKVLIAIMLLAISTVGFTACSSDDDDDTPASGDAVKMVVGTYMGTMRIGSTIFESTTLTIVNAGSSKVTLTTNKGGTTPKTVLVTMLPDNVTVSGDGDTATFGYQSSTKLIIVGTKKQKESDVVYTFEGSKQ